MWGDYSEEKLGFFTAVVTGKTRAAAQLATLITPIQPAAVKSTPTESRQPLHTYSLTLWPWSWTFTVQHTIYVKCEYFRNQEG